jgi:hypothetical protein
MLAKALRPTCRCWACPAKVACTASQAARSREATTEGVCIEPASAKGGFATSQDALADSTRATIACADGTAHGQIAVGDVHIEATHRCLACCCQRPCEVCRCHHPLEALPRPPPQLGCHHYPHLPRLLLLHRRLACCCHYRYLHAARHGRRMMSLPTPHSALSSSRPFVLHTPKALPSAACMVLLSLLVPKVPPHSNVIVLSARARILNLL